MTSFMHGAMRADRIPTMEHVGTLHSPKIRVIALVATVAVLLGVKYADAQFTSPTCVPPNCNPQVIQNIGSGESAQSASFNITGEGGVGSELQVGTQTPVLNFSTQNLIYGNVSAASSAGSILLLQNGFTDILRVGLNGASTLAGSLGLPSGSESAPALYFGGDTNTGIYSSAGDTINFTVGGNDVIQIVSDGTVIFAGDVDLGTGQLSGDGSQLTNLNASNITSGTISVARLPGTVAYTDALNVFSVNQRFSALVGVGTAPSASYALNVSGNVFANRYNIDLSNAFLDSNELQLNASGGVVLENIATANGAVMTLSTGNSTGDVNDIILSPGGTERFRVRETGGALVTGGLDVTGAVSGSDFLVAGTPLCRQDGTNCPAGGAVNSVSGSGAGISVSPTTGAVVVQNTGVTSAVSGTGISLSGGTGAVTITNTGVITEADTLQTVTSRGGTTGTAVTFNGTLTANSTFTLGNGTAVGSINTSDWDITTTGNMTGIGSITMDGSLTVGGTGAFTGNVTVGGSSVCRQNGTNCPAGGAVSSVSGSGAGISVSPTTGAVVVQNTGVTSVIAGAGISLSAGTGGVTITNTGDTNAADDITTILAGAGISVSGTGNSRTITNTGDTNAADDITGSGSASYLPKFTGTRTVGNSQIYDNGGAVGIGTTSLLSKLTVAGGGYFNGGLLSVCNGTCWLNYAAGAGDLYVGNTIEIDGAGYITGKIWGFSDLDVSGSAAFGGENVVSTYGIRASNTYGAYIAGSSASATIGSGSWAVWAWGSAYVKDNLGVGDSTPQYKLVVAGGSDASASSGGFLIVGSDGTGAAIAIDDNEIMARNGGAASTLYLNWDGGNVNVGCDNLWVDRGSYIDCSDVAEAYPMGEDLEPGDVVVWRPDTDQKVFKSRKAYDHAIAGVYSTSPGLLLSNKETVDGKEGQGVSIGGGKLQAGEMPLALVGRAPVKVTLEGGPIKPGDALTSSSTPGYAMKATSSGPVLGLALEAYDERSTGKTILAFINAHHRIDLEEIEKADFALEMRIEDLEERVRKLEAKLTY